MVFEEQEMGRNVNVLCTNDNCSVMQVRDKSGEGVMTAYDVFAGVYVIFNDFHMQHCVSEFNPNQEMLCIDHCREGRIEWELDNYKYIYFESGDMQINTRTCHKYDFSFPMRHYHGITIGFLMDEAEQSLKNVMEGISVDLHKLKKKFCPENRPFIMRAGKRIHHVFSELYEVPKHLDHIKMSYFRIKVLELLLFLESIETPNVCEERRYFYKSQVRKIKEIAELITDNLESHYTLEELSRRFNFPLTSMKLCFKGVYGTSIYAFIKDYRMNKAAVLLKQSSKTVAEIAGAVGYENPGKFASAFHSVIGMTPSEFRKYGVRMDYLAHS
ncbi:AraC family transcriptional regulator [Anaerobacterium chartisolvens]|uniref:AraC family transcriptional regulator n=1 Tax=Anaerobacterium chartisolvens TaxID=1297424 RepID=A0A369BHA6_9FIRM|nr:AraC family transcriptional regulator [Anaerobacterium chartisolvens]RCX20942.1 AraC family transcriptional regulator [Anaerobacterium chartisolvens]